MKKFTNEKVKFVKYTKQHRPSYNDERFYCFRDYLERDKNIKRLFHTDLFDVEFHGNPFKIFEQGYDLYLGSEPGSRHAFRWFIRKAKKTYR